MAAVGGGMWLMWLGLAMAEPADVLVVVTPGLETTMWSEWTDRLTPKHRVELFVPSCTATSAEAVVDDLVMRAEALDQPVVLAHGLGATVSLMAGARLHARRMVLLAPVLASPNHLLLQESLVAWQGVEAKNLSSSDDRHLAWMGSETPAPGCFAEGFREDLVAWMSEGTVPLVFDQVATPLWVGGALLDEWSPPEVLVPTARAHGFSVYRLGRHNFAPHDVGHGSMIGDRWVRRRVLREVRR